MKRMYARVTIDMAVLAEQDRVDRELARRMEAGGLSSTRREKSWRRIQGRRFYTRCLEPEMRGLIADLRDRSRFAFIGAMRLGTFFHLSAADAAARLEAFEQQLQRRRLVAEHEAAVVARRLLTWEAVERQANYWSGEVH